VKRYVQAQIARDLREKMVFLSGPRQVGKTTVALSLLPDTKNYLNWDVPSHREKILKYELPPKGRIVFDELHKYRGWRNLLKGLFDDPDWKQEILVTGSAHLDFYRFGGDSLQGRYHFLRLHPLSVAELKISTEKDFQALLALSGFPEPFFSGSQAKAKRWSLEYRSRLIREDLASLERVNDLGKLELLMLRLPALVGSPLSLNSLREDLQVSHPTVAHWVDILERLYSLFRIPPFGSDRLRAVKKEPKHYHLDWSLVAEPSFRFENLVANHLLKWVHFELDTKGRELELRYFRDVDRREVDFVVTESGQPALFVECKWEDAEISPSLRYLKAKYPDVESWQISAMGHKDYLSKDHIRVSPAVPFLKKFV
jgi:predicted AAA+ superfamily ATPase